MSKHRPPRMYFCIRDDDTSFFTRPDDLEHAYGEISRWGPVSLAIIPFCRAGPSEGVPERFRLRWSVHPLHENQPLVAYLRQRISEGRFEAMLHGYHHDEPNEVHEFAGGRDLRRKVAEGRRYLEDVLGTTVRVFVPPHNAIRRQGLRAIAAEGMDLAGTAGVRAGWSRFSARTWAVWFRLRRRRKLGGMGVPWVLDLGDHREIPGVCITPASRFHTNEAVFQSALAVGGVFCAATHYWELEAPSKHAGDFVVRDHLRRFIDRAMANPQVAWHTVGEVVANRTVAV